MLEKACYERYAYLKQLADLPYISYEAKGDIPAGKSKAGDACEVTDTAEHARRKGGDACDDGRAGGKKK